MKTKFATLTKVYTNELVEQIEATSYKKAYDYFKEKYNGEFLLNYNWKKSVVKFKEKA